MNEEKNTGIPTWTSQEFKDAYAPPIFSISENILAAHTGLEALVEFRPSRLVPHRMYIINELQQLDERVSELRRRISDLFASTPEPDEDANKTVPLSHRVSSVLREACTCPLCREGKR